MIGNDAVIAYGVTANLIAPVATIRMTESLAGKRTFDYTPENKQLSPENVVPAVVYVASEQSEWLTRRLISSGNGKIGLHSDFDMQIELEPDNSDGVWDNQSAFAAIEKNFNDAPEQLNFWGPK